MAAKKKREGSGCWPIVLFPFRLVLFILLPFILLIRVSVLAYVQFEMPAWVALGIGAFLTFILLYFYIGRISRVLMGHKKATEGTQTFSLRAALIVVGGFCLYALLYLSAGNAKTVAVQQQYTKVHPLLRLSVSALTLLDRELVITDMARVHEDYDKMGLARKKNSLHYTQADGYVHAIDLRTNTRAEWKNTVMEWYFWAMGFNTLRHIGTGDHLHVSLMIRENPAAI